MRNIRIAFLCAGFLSTLSLSAQSFTTLHLFDGRDGDMPYGGLIQATDGNFYGTTYSGGTNCANDGGCGTVFRITPEGTLTTIYSFCAQSACIDGAGPDAGLVQAPNGDFYGTTTYGGINACVVFSSPAGCGTIFKVTPDGTLTTLYTFCSNNQGGDCADGALPFGSLIRASDGNFYGTTSAGGSGNANGNIYGNGTIFKITPSGNLTTLYNFCSQSNCTDGNRPFWGVIQATDGDFYGSASAGGVNGGGTIFRMTPNGTLTTLHSFDGADGSRPDAGVVQAADGSFYGTTVEGGAYCEYGCGTVFRITSEGSLTTVFSFDLSDGEGPFGGVIQANDGNFYGTASGGGANCLNSDSCGSVFEITPSGTLTTLYNFCSQSDCSDGETPFGALLQSTNGTFYGATYYGGNDGCGSLGCGTLFSISVGLGPFVQTLPGFGKVGAAVEILGTNLTGATKVTFDGTSASFKVVSSSLITATVPAGETGKVQVATPSGKLTSNANFLVTPQVLQFSPTNGPLGTVVTTTGVSLTQTSGVGFGDRIPAELKANSDSQVTATVPNGAITGPIVVRTNGGAATSPGNFTVTQ